LLPPGERTKKIYGEGTLIYFSGTPVTWGVNLGKNDAQTAVQEATAIANAFVSAPFKKASILLEAIEIGNEADLYGNNGVRDNTWNVQQYVTQYVRVSLDSRRKWVDGAYLLS
jgi:hypothetical protein